MAEDGFCCGACEHAASVAAGKIDAPPSPPIRAPRARVTIGIRSGGKAWDWKAAADRVVVGRGSGADLALPDAAVSRKTCALEFVDGGVFVEDLASSCGTYVNGHRTSRSGLHERDEIRIGNSILSFRVDPA